LYRERYEKDPDYSELLDALAKTPVERQQLLRAKFDPANRPVGLEGLTHEEKQALEITCNSAKFNNGPAGYNECLSSQLARFDPAKRPVGLERLTREERQALEIFCSSAKLIGGPAGYNACMSSQLARFNLEQ
jgi:hypothetical protein